MNVPLITGLGALALVLVQNGFAQATGANPVLALPHVVHGSQPVYPKIAIAARVSGKVHLHVVTDGKRVAKIESETGPAMLVKSTEETVRSWEFEEHAPTEFDTTFVFLLLQPKGCEEVNSGVTMDLPARVEVRDGMVMCDVERYERLQKYLREQHVYPLELHVKVNGKEEPDPSVFYVFGGGKEFRIQTEDGFFLVPEELSKEPTIGIRAKLRGGWIQTGGIPSNRLECNWTIELGKDAIRRQGWIKEVKDFRSACVIEFDPLDGDGTVLLSQDCRGRSKGTQR